MPAIPLPDDLINATRQPSREARLPRGRAWAQQKPDFYIPSPDLVAAVKVALLLRKPLLLTGEPGTGKTEFGKYLAWKLGADVVQFDCKSDSKAQELFYSYDAVGRFQARDSGGVADASSYLRFQGLGRAIVRSHRHDDLPADVQPLIAAGDRTAEGRQSVVVIDEVDKAPRDFPNDLLNEFTRGDFSIPQLGVNRVAENPDKKPVLIVTSNSEKNLPAPFLRRCAYFHIKFPEDVGTLREIVAGRIAELPREQKELPPLFDSALKLFLELRAKAGLGRKPATAELIDWLTSMIDSGADIHQPLRAQDALVEAGLPALIKEKEDTARARTFVQEFLRQ